MVSMGKPYSRCRSFNDAVSLTIFIAMDNAQFVKFITEQLSELSRKVQNLWMKQKSHVMSWLTED